MNFFEIIKSTILLNSIDILLTALQSNLL